MRRCINDICNSSRNNMMVRSENADSELLGIVSISSTGEYLVVDGGANVVYRCILTSPNNQILESSCGVFTSDMFDPYAITIDEVKQLVYVSDFTKGVITVFDYEGLNLGDLGGTGALFATNGLAFRHGAYAPLMVVVDVAIMLLSRECSCSRIE